MPRDRRMAKLAGLIKEVISEIVLFSLADPRLKGVISITGVKPTPDLKWATVKFSVVGGDKEKKSVLAALISARKLIQSQIAKEIEIRHVPRLKFELDESVERGMRILKVLKEEFPEPPYSEEDPEEDPGEESGHECQDGIENGVGGGDVSYAENDV